MRGWQVWGRTVYDSAGKRVGEVERLGLRQGEVRRVVIKVEGRARSYLADQITLDGNRVILSNET